VVFGAPGIELPGTVVFLSSFPFGVKRNHGKGTLRISFPIIRKTKLPTAILIFVPGAGLVPRPLRLESGKFPGIQKGMGLSAENLDILPKFVMIQFILQGERVERINMEIPAFWPTHAARGDPSIPFRHANPGEGRLQARCRVRPLDFAGLSAGIAVSLRNARVGFLPRRAQSA
jgi:hypothetical protein